jgi:hypothetical protein
MVSALGAYLYLVEDAETGNGHSNFSRVQSEADRHRGGPTQPNTEVTVELSLNRQMV